MLTSDTIQPSNQVSMTMKRPLPTQQNDPLKCPRCDSTNTKFCYYNNYNKTQPRHYCKACKRHWTKGGTLRNVPVGGGRKNKRIKRSNIATTTTTNNNMDRNLGFSDPKYMFPDDKGLFFKPNESEFDQVSWDFNANFISASTTMPQLSRQNLGFSIDSNLSSMDTNTTPIFPTSYSPLLTGIKDDSTITTTRMMMPNLSNVSQPWMQVPTTSNILEQNYWTWNDIDSMVQADLNNSFEDPQMKP